MHKDKVPRSVPTATYVMIIGEVVIEGSVSGSYVYENVDQNPEETSIFQWYLDDEPILPPQGVAIDLKILKTYSGKQLKFSVVPVSVTGEIGIETFSAEKFVEPGFQGISHEENDNSYLKQWGNFSFHVPEPPDRVFVSTGGAFALIDPGTQDIYFEGQDGWGLPVPFSIVNLLKNNPATRFFSTEKDFGALINILGGNQLLVWGANIPISVPVKLTDIKSVYSNRECFAFIYKNATGMQNRIGAVGKAGSGDVIPAEIQSKLYFDEPAAIYATQNAFAVRTVSGKVYAWGNEINGGLIGADVRALLDSIQVQSIICAATAFCAIGTNGDVVTWGVPANGGTIPSAELGAILSDGGVISVTAATTAFCAITQNNKKAVSWGMAGEGGQMSPSAAMLAVRGGVVICKAARWAFCMINNLGQAEAWGAVQYGGASITPETKMEIETAFKKQFKNAAPVLLDADSHPGSRIITIEGNLSLYSNDVSFFLLSQDDSLRTKAVIAWGLNTHGGVMAPATRQALMASMVSSVYCTNGAYGVVATQGGVYGAVVVWGATLAMEDAGEIPPELATYLSSDVVELYSIKRLPYVQLPPPPPPKPPRPDPSFAARRRDGSYVLWGGNVVNQYYKPSPSSAGSVHYSNKLEVE